MSECDYTICTLNFKGDVSDLCAGKTAICCLAPHTRHRPGGISCARFGGRHRHWLEVAGGDDIRAGAGGAGDGFIHGDDSAVAVGQLHFVITHVHGRRCGKVQSSAAADGGQQHRPIRAGDGSGTHSCPAPYYIPTAASAEAAGRTAIFDRRRLHHVHRPSHSLSERSSMGIGSRAGNRSRAKLASGPAC